MKAYLYQITESGISRLHSLLHKSLLSFLGCSIYTLALAGPGGQTNTDILTFRNARLESGVDGKDGAVYRFPQVNNDVDALVKITGRSNANVKLVSIDITNTGWDQAFQPQVTYGTGRTAGATDYWMEFEISFVNKDKTTPASVSGFNVTGLDIDGNGSNAHEYLSFYQLNTYTLESHSLLGVSNLLDCLVGDLLSLLTPGKRFDGPVTQYSGIDTTATRIMETNTYSNKNSFRVRTGAATTGAADVSDRMYSLYFKSFTYQAPAQFTLPLVLTSFDATLNNRSVVLKWETGMEKKLSHFVIERSTNGRDFDDAGVVFATGNSGVKQDYSFTDAINSSAKGILYYRLRMVDELNSYQNTEIRIIRFGNDGTAEMRIQAFPNPVVNELRITIPGAWQEKQVNYDLYNGNGQLVKHIASKQANQTEIVDMQGLGRGMYVVKAYTSTETLSQLVVKN